MIQRSTDGSILFDFSTEYNSAEHVVCNPLDEKCQQPNQPPYNDTYMKRVREIAATEFQGTTALDPFQSCRALGVPRAGAPHYIMQSPQVIVVSLRRRALLDLPHGLSGRRPHPDMKTYETTYFGDSIGHWEGDTLVVDTVGFNDDTWLGGGGPEALCSSLPFTAKKNTPIERFTRDGNTLTYDVTVEDPDALTKPWVLATRHIRHAGPGLEVPGEDALTENICTPTGAFRAADLRR